MRYHHVINIVLKEDIVTNKEMEYFQTYQHSQRHSNQHRDHCQWVANGMEMDQMNKEHNHRNLDEYIHEKELFDDNEMNFTSSRLIHGHHHSVGFRLDTRFLITE